MSKNYNLDGEVIPPKDYHQVERRKNPCEVYLGGVLILGITGFVMGLLTGLLLWG